MFILHSALFCSFRVDAQLRARNESGYEVHKLIMIDNKYIQIYNRCRARQGNGSALDKIENIFEK